MILQKLKQDAEAYLGESVTRAVVTVPAYFSGLSTSSDERRGSYRRTYRRGALSTSLLRHRSHTGLTKKPIRKILIFDLGGGTFDVSILGIG